MPDSFMVLFRYEIIPIYEDSYEGKRRIISSGLGQRLDRSVLVDRGFQPRFTRGCL